MLSTRACLYRATSTGFFDPVARRFLPDTYIEGECPHCHYARARGNQCENCGRLLEPEDLIRSLFASQPAPPRSSAARPNTSTLDLPKLQQRAAGLGARASPLATERLPLHDQLPRGRPAAAGHHARSDMGRAAAAEVGPGWDDKRIYVWFEACSGYLTAAVEWAKNIGAAHEVGALVEGTRSAASTTSSARTTSRSTRSSGRPS